MALTPRSGSRHRCMLRWRPSPTPVASSLPRLAGNNNMFKGPNNDTSPSNPLRLLAGHSRALNRASNTPDVQHRNHHHYRQQSPHALPDLKPNQNKGKKSRSPNASREERVGGEGGLGPRVVSDYHARRRDSRVNGADLYVVRITQQGTGNARPCSRCIEWCKWAGIKRVFHWEGRTGSFEVVKVNDEDTEVYVTCADAKLRAGTVCFPTWALPALPDLFYSSPERSLYHGRMVVDLCMSIATAPF